MTRFWLNLWSYKIIGRARIRRWVCCRQVGFLASATDWSVRVGRKRTANKCEIRSREGGSDDVTSVASSEVSALGSNAVQTDRPSATIDRKTENNWHFPCPFHLLITSIAPGQAPMTVSEHRAPSSSAGTHDEGCVAIFVVGSDPVRRTQPAVPPTSPAGWARTEMRFRLLSPDNVLSVDIEFY